MDRLWPKHEKQLYKELYRVFHPSTYKESYNTPNSYWIHTIYETLSEALEDGQKYGLLPTSTDITNDDSIPELWDKLSIEDDSYFNWSSGILLFDVLYDIVEEFRCYCGENGIDPNCEGKCMDDFPPKYDDRYEGDLKQIYYVLHDYMLELVNAGIPVGELIDEYKLKKINLVDNNTNTVESDEILDEGFNVDKVSGTSPDVEKGDKIIITNNDTGVDIPLFTELEVKESSELNMNGFTYKVQYVNHQTEYDSGGVGTVTLPLKHFADGHEKPIYNRSEISWLKVYDDENLNESEIKDRTQVNPELKIGDVIMVIDVDGEHDRMPERYGRYKVIEAKQGNVTHEFYYYDIVPVDVDCDNLFKCDYLHKIKTLYRGDTWVYTTKPIAAKVGRKTISEGINIDKVQSVMDWAGLVPGVGDIIDFINAIIYLGRGKEAMAFLSVVAIIPVVGSVVSLPFRALFKFIPIEAITKMISTILKGGGKTGAELLIKVGGEKVPLLLNDVLIVVKDNSTGIFEAIDKLNAPFRAAGKVNKKVEEWGMTKIKGLNGFFRRLVDEPLSNVGKLNKVAFKQWKDLMTDAEYYKIISDSKKWPKDVVDHMENNLPMTLRKELADERMAGLSASHKEPEWFKSMNINGGKNAKPTLIKVEDLLKNDEATTKLMALSPQEDLDLINRRYGTNYKSDIVHDSDPGRVQRYSELDAGTAAPSTMIDGEITFGVGRVKAAILRGDDHVRVWTVNSNASLLNEHKQSKVNPQLMIGDEIIVIDVGEKNRSKRMFGGPGSETRPDKYIRYFVTKVYEDDKRGFHYGLNRPDVDVTDPNNPGVWDKTSTHKYLYPGIDTWMFNPKGQTMRYEDAFQPDHYLSNEEYEELYGDDGMDDEGGYLYEHKQSKLNPELMVGDEVTVINADKSYGTMNTAERFKDYVVTGIKQSNQTQEMYYNIIPIDVTEDQLLDRVLDGGENPKREHLYPTDTWMLRKGFRGGEVVYESEGSKEEHSNSSNIPTLFQKTLTDMGVQLKFVGTFGFGISGMFSMVKDVLEGRYPSLSEGEIILIFLSAMSYMSIDLVTEVKKLNQQIQSRNLTEYVSKVAEVLTDFERVAIKIGEKSGFVVSSLSELLGYTFLLVPILDITNKLISENAFDVVSLASYLKGIVISIGIFYIRNVFNSLVLRLRNIKKQEQENEEEYYPEDETIDESYINGRKVSDRWSKSNLITESEISELSLLDPTNNNHLGWMVNEVTKQNWANINILSEIDKFHNSKKLFTKNTISSVIEGLDGEYTDILESPTDINSYKSITELSLITNKVIKKSKLYEDTYMARIAEKATTDVVKDVFDVIRVYDGGEDEFILPDYYSDIDGDEYDYGTLKFNVWVRLFEDNINDSFTIDAYTTGQYNDTVELIVVLGEDFTDKDYENLYIVLSEYVRHEIEHVLQEIDPERPDIPENKDGLTPFEYYTQKHEVDAQKVGFKRRAKMEDRPIEDVIRDYIEYRQSIDQLSDTEKQELVSKLTNP